MINKDPAGTLSVLPQPQLLHDEEFPLDMATHLPASALDEPRIAARIAELFAAEDDAALRQRLQVHVRHTSAPRPVLHDDESYYLQVSDERVCVLAETTWGALHGLTTLYQLQQQKQIVREPVGQLGITDAPRFPWRGVLLDVARHFQPVHVLKRVLDGMAVLKLNVLHLHLTDDQAVRLRSRRFPKLAGEQAYHMDELADLVAYAQMRGIRIVPELDVPGHVTSWLVAYPELGFGQVAATRRFGVHKACLDPTSEATYRFLTDLFTELAEVFPDEYVHIGGDEVHPGWWSEDTAVQSYMQQHNLAGVSDLQNHFNHRLCAILQTLGKRVVAWDEVLHSNTPELVVQNWRGATTRDRALRQGRSCLVSAGYYLDLHYPNEFHYQYDPGASQTALLALEDNWQTDPRMSHVAAGVEWTKQWRQQQQPDYAEHNNVLGGEACLWSELVDEQTLEVRLWSRLPSVAERLWSPPTVDDMDSFYRRLAVVLQLPQLDVANIQQQRLSALGLTTAQQQIVALLEPVKWYARLLGEAALQARLQGSEMPQARPYDTHTPLNRVVDFISPESFAARAFVDLPWTRIDEHVQQWRALQTADWPGDMHAIVAAVRQAGDLLAAWQAHKIDAAECHRGLQPLAQPQGEYMFAVMHFLMARIA